MKTLLLLVVSLFGPWLFWRIAPLPIRRHISSRTAGRLGVSLFFLVTGAAHFVLTSSMALMLPPWVPRREDLIFFTGFLELAGAVGIWIPRFQKITGWALIAMLVAILPSNIYSAFARVPFGGHDMGPRYLLFRIPFQAILIAWIHWSAIQSARSAPGRTIG